MSCTQRPTVVADEELRRDADVLGEVELEPTAPGYVELTEPTVAAQRQVVDVPSVGDDGVVATAASVSLSSTGLRRVTEVV